VISAWWLLAIIPTVCLVGWCAREALFVRQIADLEPETRATMAADVERKLRTLQRGTEERP
jgi:hypothetical protein